MTRRGRLHVATFDALLASGRRAPGDLHTFVAAVGGPHLAGAVRVNVGLWRAPESTVNAVKKPMGN